jgi:hypothetical protein
MSVILLCGDGNSKFWRRRAWRKDDLRQYERHLTPSCSFNLICGVVDDHGVHGEMRNDAMNVAATALDTNPEEKDISKHIKVPCFPLPLLIHWLDIFRSEVWPDMALHRRE